MDDSRNSNWRWIAVAILPALLLAAWQAAWPWPFFSDDSFISLRFSERLLQGHGLTWTDGADGTAEYVEGYSNLLWVLLTAGLGAIGMELVTAARVLGATATVIGLWYLAAALRPRDLRTAIVAAMAPVLVASTQPVMIWTLAGLEGPLVMALLAWGFGNIVLVYASQQGKRDWRTSKLLALGLPFALACWARPDGPLWALTAGVGLAAISSSEGFRTATCRAFWFGLPALTAVTAQLVFRLSYYGGFVPNTAHVKAEFDPAAIKHGIAFVQNALLAMPGLTVAAAGGFTLMLLHQKTRAFSVLLGLPILAWLCYLAAIGGDHFPGLRLLHGALVPMAFMAAVGLLTIRTPELRTTTAAVIAIFWGLWNVDVARNDVRSKEARAETWEWHGKVLGETLGRAFSQREARIAVEAAGALPYYSKLPALDMLGLCDRTIATTPFPKWLGTMRPEMPKPPGHMRGNGSYVMEQAPDLITFHHGPGLPQPVFVSACEFESDPRFLGAYRCILLDLGNPEILPGVYEPHLAPLWIRTEGRAGIERSADRVVVPAYLFGSFQAKGPAINRYQPESADPTTKAKFLANQRAITQFYYGQRAATAQPAPDDSLELVLASNSGASLPLRLPVGKWRVDIEPSPSRARLEVTAGGGLSNGVLTVNGNAPLVLLLVANEEPGEHPMRIVLHRTP